MLQQGKADNGVQDGMQNQPFGASQKCPVLYSLVRHLSFLNPVMMATKKGRLFKQIQEGLDIAANLWQGRRK